MFYWFFFDLTISINSFIRFSRPKLEISEPFETLNYRKEAQAFVEKNYCRVVGHLRSQKHVSPPKPPRKTRGNISFLHPDGGSPITDSSSVPKNISLLTETERLQRITQHFDPLLKM